MPVKKKPTAKQLAARKKFVEMVRAKARAKKIATTHKDTKSHNVNVKVVSGMKKKSEKRQTGTSVKSKDKLYEALPPGKRTTGKGKTKHTYYERRANRSDKPGSLLGIGRTIAGMKKTYIALYETKNDMFSIVFDATSLSEARSIAQLHKRHTPSLSKTRVKVKLLKS